MFMETPIKKNIDISFFLNELYRIKYQLEEIIIKLEEMKVDDRNV